MKKTKLLTILAVLAAIIVSGIFLMGFIPEEDDNEIYDYKVEYAEHFEYGGEPLQFESFKLSENGMSMESSCFEAYKTENGVHLEHYLSVTHWEDYDEKEERTIVHAIDGGKELYDELCALLGNCRVDMWDGFHGSNPPDILDGSSMKFTAKLSNGNTISSSGSNNFPSNYGTLSSTLYEMTCYQKITDTLFDNGDYKITVPESWVGAVTAHYSYDSTSFSINNSDGESIPFFIIDDSTYGYNSGNYYDDTSRIGRLIPDNTEADKENNLNVKYIDARPYYSLEDYEDSLGETEKIIAEGYEQDIQSVIDSIAPSAGYTFVPEDGTTLYYSDASLLYNSAESLWLYAFIRAEYAGGEEPVKINGKNYMLIYPQYYADSSLDGVKNKFLEYFSEEYTNKLISESMAKKDMIVKDGKVYVSCKVFGDDHIYFNSWVADVENKNDGTFDVIVKARKSVETIDQGTKYIDDIFRFPAKMNENRKFVFTDFPYWEKTVEKQL